MVDGGFILDDSEFSAPIFSPVCTLCAWMIDLGEKTCRAYPEGVPIDIWVGDTKHDSVRTDQVGDYVYEERDI